MYRQRTSIHSRITILNNYVAHIENHIRNNVEIQLDTIEQLKFRYNNKKSLPDQFEQQQIEIEELCEENVLENKQFFYAYFSLSVRINKP